jgi:hypothetical protein
MIRDWTQTNDVVNTKTAQDSAALQSVPLQLMVTACDGMTFPTQQQLGLSHHY